MAMPVSHRRLLLVASFGIPFVALISAMAIWGFGIEISNVLTESAIFPSYKLIMALGSFLSGCVMTAVFTFGMRLPALPVKGSLLLLGLALLWRGLPLLMTACNSVAILFAADQASLLFSVSAWGALACLLVFFPAAIAYALVYAKERRAASLTLGPEQVPF